MVGDLCPSFLLIYSFVYIALTFKDDRAFSLLYQELPQILVLCFPSTCCQILKKNWGHRENLGESGGQTFKGSDREKCQV